MFSNEAEGSAEHSLSDFLHALGLQNWFSRLRNHRLKHIQKVSGYLLDGGAFKNEEGRSYEDESVPKLPSKNEAFLGSFLRWYVQRFAHRSSAKKSESLRVRC